MSQEESVQKLIDASLERENRYDWDGAIEKYSNALETVSDDDEERKATLLEAVANCRKHSAWQQSTRESYTERIEESINSYAQAADLYLSIDTDASKPRAKLSRASSSVLRASLEIEPEAKKHLLDGALELLRNAEGEYQEIGEHIEVAKIQSEIGRCLWASLQLQSDKNRREDTVQEGIRLLDESIRVFSDNELREELSSTLSLASRLHSSATVSMDTEREESLRYRRRALEYAKRALRLSEELQNNEALSQAHCAMGTAVYRGTGVEIDEHLHHFQKAQESVELTGNKTVMAEVSWNLAANGVWRMHLAEAPEEKEQIMSRVKDDARVALECAEILGYEGIAALTLAWLAEANSYLARETGTTLEEKAELHQQALELCREAVERGISSGVVFAKGYALHEMSKILYHIAMAETSDRKKGELLDEALHHQETTIALLERVRPSDFWQMSLSHNYLGLIRSELADLRASPEEQEEFLREAVSSMERSIRLCATDVETSALAGYAYTLAVYQDRYATALGKLFKRTRDPQHSKEAITSLDRSSTLWRDLGFPSRGAEAHWVAGMMLDQLKEYSDAAREFNSAAEGYREAAEKMPTLAQYFSDHASYMSARRMVAEARSHHALEDFSRAGDLYEEAARSLKDSERFGDLATYFEAEKRLEEAEEKAKQALRTEAIELFRSSQQAFSETASRLSNHVEEVQIGNLRSEMRRLADTARLRRDYCVGREKLEEAELLSREGDRRSSASLYGEAAEIFRSLADELRERRDAQEFRSMSLFCEAWRRMKLAEMQTEADGFQRSARMFLEAREDASRRVALMCVGNAHYCRSMALILQFVEEGKQQLYAEAKAHLESASINYSKGRFDDAFVWTEAGKRLVDAYVYIGDAEKEKDPIRRVELFRLAEKCFEASAESYGKIGYANEQQEALEAIERVKREREFAMSLSTVVKTPTSASSSSLSSQVSSMDEAGGLEEFEQPNLLGSLAVTDEVDVDDRFDATLDLVNTGKDMALLIRIDEVAPEGIVVVLPPEGYRLENGSLDLEGPSLKPFQVKSLKFTLKGSEVGRYILAPKVLYATETGKLRTCVVEPVSVSVRQVEAFKFRTETSQKVFDHLVEEFVKDYMERSVVAERAGWRTRPEIASGAGISRSSLYGRAGEMGSALKDLIERGLVEKRVFPGERGRGGNIVKARIHYEKEPIKKHVDELVKKGI